LLLKKTIKIVGRSAGRQPRSIPRWLPLQYYHEKYLISYFFLPDRRPGAIIQPDAGKLRLQQIPPTKEKVVFRTKICHNSSRYHSAEKLER